MFAQVGILLKQWKERLNDIRRKQRSYSFDGEYDKPDRGTTEPYGRDVSGDGLERRTASFVSGGESKLAGIKQRVARAASNLAKYRGTVGALGKEGWRNSDIAREDSGAEQRKSAMERIGGEVEQRKQTIAETEQGIVEARQQIERVRDIDERIRQIKARRADGRTTGVIGEYGAGSSSERYNYPAEGQRDTDTAGATERIAELMREAEQREQSRERASIKERLEANKRIVSEREREVAKCKSHDKGLSR